MLIASRDNSGLSVIGLIADYETIVGVSPSYGVYELDPLIYDRCGAEMKLLALITD